MEKGFFHPSMGYWQANGEPGEEILAAYPDGTVEVPLRPSHLHTWVDGVWVAPEPANLPVPTQFEIDQQRYQRRAAVKDELVAWMAADNMARVRAGVWTVADLQALLVVLNPINAMMQTLSYELAAQAIADLQVPLMTDEIKAAWVAKLTEHFYLS